MADWNSPVLATAYVDFLAHLKARDLDAAQMFSSAPTNPAESMMRYVRASNKFQEYLSGIWTDKVLSVAGGGTGAATASGARTNLGLGTMAVQNANNVNISGGTIDGVTLDVNDFSGNLDDSQLPLGGTWTLSSLLAMSGHAFHTLGFGLGYRTGAGTTLTDTDCFYECTGGTIVLPDCTTITKRVYIIKRSGTTVTLDPTSSQEISINGANVTTYAALGANQTIILISNGTRWIAMTMGGTMFRDTQVVDVTMSSGNSSENQAMPATVNDVKKALIIPTSGMMQSAVSGSAPISMRAFFADSGGSEETTGSATHLKLVSAFNAVETQVYRLQVQEWE